MTILISGANGKMGKKVYSKCLEKGIKAVGIDRISDFSNKDFPIYDNFNTITEKVDVLIDFSSPTNLDNILSFLKKNKINAVLCTTGYTADDIKKIEETSKQVAIFKSFNMSLGVNVLIDLVKDATKKLADFDIEIIEKHHNEKVDAPSGTAKMIADEIKNIDKDKFEVYGRNGIVGKRDSREIGIHSIRGGNIVGEHQVIFCGNDETITLTHQATDRGVFASGALSAAKFIIGKKQGIFNMNDLLKSVL